MSARFIAWLCIGLLFAVLLGCDGDGNEAAPHSQELLNAVSAIPVQHEGRIKPLSSVAGVYALQVYQRERVKVDGESLGPVAWWLETAFRPDSAREQKVIRVDDIASVQSIGLDTGRSKQRDSFSYRQLEPGLARLNEMVREYVRKRDLGQDLDRNQKAIMALFGKVQTFESMLATLGWARADYSLGGDGDLEALFGGAKSVRFSQVMQKMDTLRARYDSLREPGVGPEAAAKLKAVEGLLVEVSQHVQDGDRLPIVPRYEAKPDAASEEIVVGAWESWQTPMNVALRQMRRGGVPAKELDVLAAIENFARAGDDEGRLAGARAVRGSIESIVEFRGARETRSLEREMRYHRDGNHVHAGWMFLGGFLLSVVALVLVLFAPRKVGRIGRWAALGTTGYGLGMLVYAIVQRCLIMERPPISTLYETILFVTASVVLLGILFELFLPWALSVMTASGLGALGIVGAFAFSESKGQDTFVELQAVLRNNFWLTTHVVIINLGYAAAMFAAGVAGIWLVSYTIERLARLAPPRQSFKLYTRIMVTIVYGLTCAGVLLTTVGTILGGVWANDSWGRFWGWDPKENGALLICLAQIFIVHGRLGGHLKQFGICLWACLTGWVVIFSWFGVNQLGIGLHAYGFDEGLAIVISLGQWTFVGLAGVGVLGRLIDWVASRSPRQEIAPGPSPEPQPES